MTLTNLVKSKNQIKEVELDSLLINYESCKNDLLSVLSTLDAGYMDFIESLQKELSDLEKIIENTKSILSAADNRIKQEINELTKDWHTRGYRVSSGFKGSDSLIVEKERETRSYVTSDFTKQKILGVIQQYTNPKFASLEIGPGDGVWTPHLVAGDPLYLVDIHQEFLDSTAFKFPEQYRKRLRPYLLEFDDCFNLSSLPQNQIGFIFSWNVFDYFPATETRMYLKSCYDVLRPGGHMIFSYNNCDYLENVNYVEIGNKSWMTEDLMLSICKEIGFDILKNNSTQESWLCIKKPGILKTTKTHQALGEIINQST